MPESSPIVTRFAPSPTGALHIGGARTALFNWAFARRHGGRFILRMEDTDQARSSAQSARGILDQLLWLGLNWDEGPDPTAADPYVTQIGQAGPYFQSQRLELYQTHVQRLLDAGLAYRCFKTAQELDAMRQAARAGERKVAYDPSDSRSLTPGQIAELQAAGKPSVVRFRMPGQAVTVLDAVLGDVTVQADELEDLVILKADGFPTYHFAVVVDDALMGVTHVIRGQEHLNNALRHAALIDALGFDRPVWAHVPLIFNADGSKMSKRDKAKAVRGDAAHIVSEAGAQGLIERLDQTAEEDDPAVSPVLLDAFLQRKSDDDDLVARLARALDVTLPEIDVLDFRRTGYLPDVLLNYLAKLGWSPGGDLERFDLDYLVAHFDLDGLGKSNARFDRDKLFRFNADTIAALPAERFASLLREHFAVYHPQFLAKLSEEQFAVFAASYQPRTRVLSEPATLGAFLIAADDAIVFDEKAVAKVLHKNDGEGLAVLGPIRDLLAELEPFDDAAIEACLKSFAEERELGMGKIAQPLRVAMTGSTVSPGIGQTLAMLGREAVLARIDRCLKQLAPNP